MATLRLPMVARCSGLAAVGRVEYAGGRDADPELVGIGRMGDDVVKDQPAAAGDPVGAGRVVGETLDMLPGFAVVLAHEEPGGLDPGIEPAMRPGQGPDGYHLVLALGIDKAFVEANPAFAPIG